MSARRTLIIDRARWLRGNGDAVLVDPAGCMCCLGFYSVACGLPREQLVDHASPATAIAEPLPPEMQWLADCESGSQLTSAVAVRLMTVNDDRDLRGDELRERRIVAIFRQHGVDVVFVDEVQA